MGDDKVWGVFSLEIFKEKFLMNNFLSIFSYLTTSSSAALTPSPLGLARALTPLEGQIVIYDDKIRVGQQLHECVSGPLKKAEQA